MLAVQYAQQLRPSSSMERASAMRQQQQPQQRTPSNSSVGSSRNAASTSSTHSRSSSHSSTRQPRESHTIPLSAQTPVPQTAPSVASVRKPVKPPLPTPPPPPQAAAVRDVDIDSYPATELLHLLASLLSQIAAQNDKLPGAAGGLSSPPSSAHSESRQPLPSMAHAASRTDLTTAARMSLNGPDTLLSFHARNIPSISLDAYLARILK